MYIPDYYEFCCRVNMVAGHDALEYNLHKTKNRIAQLLLPLAGEEQVACTPKKKLEAIAATALGDGTLFYNPEDMDFKDCLMVLRAAWEGIPLNIKTAGSNLKNG